MILEVPYKSQHDPDGKKSKNDCGPACVAMVLNYYGEKVTTDGVFARTGAGPGYVTINQLKKAIASFGYNCYYRSGQTVGALEKLILEKQIPPIVLVHYAPLLTRQDKNFKGGHFLILTGFWFFNDPDFWGKFRPHGKNHHYPRHEFLKAWSEAGKDGNPIRSFLVIERKKPIKPPSSGNYYKGLDLDNKESMKVAVDVWHDLKEGKLIRPADCPKEVIKIEATNSPEPLKKDEREEVAMDTSKKEETPNVKAGKEFGRLVLLSTISYLLTEGVISKIVSLFLAPLNPEVKLLITCGLLHVLKSFDKWLHEQGKITGKEGLLGVRGLTGF